MKRGTDHNWEIRKYSGDVAFYAHCKCGFEYCCSRSYIETKEDGTHKFKTEIVKFYQYCPCCGARKKWCNEEPKKYPHDRWH